MLGVNDRQGVASLDPKPPRGLIGRIYVKDD